MNTVETLIDIANDLGWKMVSVREDGTVEYELESSSPACQDIIIYVNEKDSSKDSLPERLIDSLASYINDYDPSEEASKWLDPSGHGTNGAPERMIDVYNDMVAVMEMAQELLDAWKGNRPDILVCSECGSPDVKVQAWVNANTHEFIDLADPDNDDEGNNWCEDCQEHTRLCPLSEFEQLMDDWAKTNGRQWPEDASYEKKREIHNQRKNEEN